jgi:TATA-box binding protein (TBP) (component of TFIID and TFIIIB)
MTSPLELEAVARVLVVEAQVELRRLPGVVVRMKMPVVLMSVMYANR